MKTIPKNPQVQRAAIAILHYIGDRPQAKDSAGGIAQWWVAEDLAVVEKALRLLVEAGAIEKAKHLYQGVARAGKPRSFFIRTEEEWRELTININRKSRRRLHELHLSFSEEPAQRRGK